MARRSRRGMKTRAKGGASIVSPLEVNKIGRGEGRGKSRKRKH